MRDSAAAIRNGRIALLVILLIAAALRFATIDYSMSFDEIASMIFARQPLSNLWGEWMVRETNPPLFYTLLHIWIGMFGESDVAIKTLPALIGLASIALGYACGRKLGGVVAGVAVAALMAVSAPHIFMSQLARGYILTVFGVLLSIHGLIDLLRWKALPERPLLIGALARYVLGALIALYGHTMLVLFVTIANVAAFGDIVLRWRIKRWLLLPWIAANALILLLWAWWGWMTVRQLGGGGSNITWMKAPSAFDAVWMMREQWVSINYGLAGKLGALVIALLIGHALWRGRRRGRILALLGGAVAVAAILFAISAKTPVLNDRTIFWPGMLVLLALGTAVADLPRRWMQAVAMIVLVAASLAQHAAWSPDRELEHYDRLSTILRAHPERPVLVYDESMAMAVQYYCALQAADGRCPLHIVTLDPTTAPNWYRGMSGTTNIAQAQATAFVGDRPFVTVKRDDKDLEPLFAGNPRWAEKRQRLGIGLYLAEWTPR